MLDYVKGRDLFVCSKNQSAAFGMLTYTGARKNVDLQANSNEEPIWLVILMAQWVAEMERPAGSENEISISIFTVQTTLPPLWSTYRGKTVWISSPKVKTSKMCYGTCRIL